MEEEEEYMSRLGHYIEIVAIEMVGVDKDGEILFCLTDKAEEVAPELIEAHQEYVDNSLMQLYKDGLINITYDENLEAIIELSEEGKEKAIEMGLIDTGDFDIPNN